MPSEPTTTAARPCSSCGRVRAECRTPDQPFLSCCNDCRANDGDTHSAPKGEVCTGPCDHDGHERRGPTWFGWYEPATAAPAAHLDPWVWEYVGDLRDHLGRDHKRRAEMLVGLGRLALMDLHKELHGG